MQFPFKETWNRTMEKEKVLEQNHGEGFEDPCGNRRNNGEVSTGAARKKKKKKKSHKTLQTFKDIKVVVGLKKQVCFSAKKA